MKLELQTNLAIVWGPPRLVVGIWPSNLVELYQGQLAGCFVFFVLYLLTHWSFIECLLCAKNTPFGHELILWFSKESHPKCQKTHCFFGGQRNRWRRTESAFLRVPWCFKSVRDLVCGTDAEGSRIWVLLCSIPIVRAKSSKTNNSKRNTRLNIFTQKSMTPCSVNWSTQRFSFAASHAACLFSSVESWNSPISCSVFGLNSGHPALKSCDLLAVGSWTVVWHGLAVDEVQ